MLILSLDWIFEPKLIFDIGKYCCLILKNFYVLESFSNP
jgi:hypothetical protein